MNRKRLATITALIMLSGSVLTEAVAGTLNASRFAPSNSPSGTPTVSSILWPDPLHGLADAVAAGMYALYEKAGDADGE